MYSRVAAWHWHLLARGARYLFIGLRRAGAGFAAMNERASQARARRRADRAEVDRAGEDAIKQPNVVKVFEDPVHQERAGHMTVSDIWDNAPLPTRKWNTETVILPRGVRASNYAPAVPDSGDGPRWMLPSVEKLAPPESHGGFKGSPAGNGRLVEETLADHGVRVEVSDVRAGPRVVQFGLSPGWVPKKAGTAMTAQGSEAGSRCRAS